MATTSVPILSRYPGPRAEMHRRSTAVEPVRHWHHIKNVPNTSNQKKGLQGGKCTFCTKILFRNAGRSKMTPENSLKIDDKNDKMTNSDDKIKGENDNKRSLRVHHHSFGSTKISVFFPITSELHYFRWRYCCP